MRITVSQAKEAQQVRPGERVWYDDDVFYVDEVRISLTEGVYLGLLPIPHDAKTRRRFIQFNRSAIVPVVPDGSVHDLLGGLIADCLDSRGYSIFVDGVGLIEGRNAERHEVDEYRVEHMDGTVLVVGGST